MSTMTKVQIGFVAVMLLAFIVAINIGTGDPSPSRSTRSTPTADSVISAINRSSDCEALQDIFDTYADSHDRADDLDDKQRFTGYMTAANNRMSEVGCYD